MAQQQAAPGPESLRLSVFQVAADSGLVNPRALENFFNTIQEEDEDVSTIPGSTNNSQRNTTSSENSGNYSYPLTPPHSSTTTSPQLRLNTQIRFEEPRARFIEDLDNQVPPPLQQPQPVLPDFATPTSKKQTGKLRKFPSQADLLQVQTPILAPTTPEHETAGENFILRGLKGKKEKSAKAKEEKAREKQEKQSSKEKEKEEKAIKEHQRERGRSISAKGDDDDKKRGFFGFRMKSKERKAAGKEQATPVAELPPMPLPASYPPPPPLPTPLATAPQEPLPIAELYRRPQEEVSFRLPKEEPVVKPKAEDAPPRIRDYEFERPHPPWRSEPSGSPHIKRFRKLPELSDEPPAEEIHVLPPGQELQARSTPPPAESNKHVLDEAIHELLKEVEELPAEPRIVNSTMIDEYYGIKPTKKPERPPMLLIPNNEPLATPVVQDNLLAPPQMAPTPLTPSMGVPRSGRPSPNIVPSPNPLQMGYGGTEPEAESKEQPLARKNSNKRNGVRFAIPPALGSPLLPPRRPTAYIPPPTPPPTTELPPIPSSYTTTESDSRPPSATGSRSATPLDRPPTAQSMTEPLRLKVNTNTHMQRGKMSPFPTRPITPVTRPDPASGASAPTPITQRRIGLPSNPRERVGSATPDEIDMISRVHAPFVDLAESPPPAPIQRNRSKRMGVTGNANYNGIPRYLQQSQLRGGGRGGEPDSDDDTASQYSVDTYYKRTTLYEKESTYGDAQVDDKTWAELRAKRLAQIEAERTAGRERLVRLLGANDADDNYDDDYGL